MRKEDLRTINRTGNGDVEISEIHATSLACYGKKVSKVMLKFDDNYCDTKA
jgi:hypothetical protein